MKYMRNEALGLVETLGMVPALVACDSMLKAAGVELVAYENVGSTLVTVVVTGDVAACQQAVKAGSEDAARIGKVTAANVMKRPDTNIGEVVAVHAVEPGDPSAPYTKSLAAIETFGLVYVLEAADAMVKAADVEIIGYENVASGYISILVRGDVAACESAVKAGVQAVKQMGAEPYSTMVIARPHPGLDRIVERYELSTLLA